MKSKYSGPKGHNNKFDNKTKNKDKNDGKSNGNTRNSNDKKESKISKKDMILNQIKDNSNKKLHALQQISKKAKINDKKNNRFNNKKNITKGIVNENNKSSNDNDDDNLDDFLTNLSQGKSVNDDKKELDMESNLSNLVKNNKNHVEKLKGAKFRWLNEILYTNKSNKALQLFQNEPEFFEIYHQGFRKQVTEWPVNPVDYYINVLKDMYKDESITNDITVADMGCGDAKIARVIDEEGYSDKLKIFSYDLVNKDGKQKWVNKYITPCDISNTPMKDSTADIVIFSLSLMGTNFLDFIKEAYRILKTKSGKLLISEVVSRFPDTEKFIEAIENIGFNLIQKEQFNKMFIRFEFEKVKHKNNSKDNEEDANNDDSKSLLTPCLYKRR